MARFDAACAALSAADPKLATVIDAVGPCALKVARLQSPYEALFESLPIAGRDGTLVDRMRRGPARRRCHAKTGTLSDVSALSGF